MMKDFFHNKTIVITGVSSGLGRALVMALAPYQCRIAGLSRNTAALQNLKQEVETLGSEFLPLPCDVSNETACREAIECILKNWNQIDILINNAGQTNIALFRSETHLEITRNIMETNFFGAIYCTAFALNSIINQKGSIVIISSVAGFSPLVGRTAYAASKHALHGFFNTLRAELYPAGVHILVVCPQFIKTNIRHNMQQVVEGQELTPEFVAQKILRGIVHKKSFLAIGKTAIFAWWLNRLLPALYARLMYVNQIKKIKNDR